MEARPGIISPDGNFYPCGYGCHEALAKKVCNELNLYTIYDAPRTLTNTQEGFNKFKTSYVDTLLDKGWAIIQFQMNGDPLFQIEKKFTAAQHEIVDKLVDEFSCMTSEEFSKAMRDNRENYSDVWSCGFTYSYDLDMERIRMRLSYEKSDYQPNYTLLVTPY